MEEMGGKRMKQISKKMVTCALIMALGCSLIPVSLVSASKGTHDGSNIELNDPEKDSWNSIYNTWDNEFSKVSGVSYDKKTNTLTLSKYVNANAELRINEMGDDFKIKVSGANELKSINAEGDVWGCSLEVSGRGTLTVNKNRKAENAIHVYGKCISNMLKVKEGVTLTAYKRNDDTPSIYVEGKNRNSISIFGVSGSAYAAEGPYQQHENVPVVTLATCMESTYTDFDGDTAQYAVVKSGDGYDLFRKTQETVQGYPIYENAYIWRESSEIAGVVNEDAVIEAVLLDYNQRDADLFAKAGDSGYDGLYYNWDSNYFAYCKLTKLPNSGVYFASDLEQIENPDVLPGGWEFKVVGDNYVTQYWGDLTMLGKASISKKTAKKGGLTVKWGIVAGAQGYQVRYSASQKMTDAWYQDLSSSKKSVTIGNLKSKTTIYVQVRAVSTDARGGKLYGGWSTTVNIKIK